MNTKFLLSPAYLASIAALIVGAVLAGTRLMVVGWIIFIIGLALNALALVILANRDYLRTAPAVNAPGDATTANSSTAEAESTEELSAETEETNVSDKPIAASKVSKGKITDSYRVFPDKK